MDALINIEGLAKKLGISEPTIYRRRSKGYSLPPAIRIGRALRWRESDVNAWLADQVEEPSR